MNTDVAVSSELPSAGASRPAPRARRWFSFIGAGSMVAVGYMDPGNWATDLAAGAQYGYALLSVVLLASLAAMLLQWVSSRVGLVTGRDLAELCRERFGRKMTGSCGSPARSRSSRATSPKWSAARWPCSCCSASRWRQA